MSHGSPSRLDGVDGQALHGRIQIRPLEQEQTASGTDTRNLVTRDEPRHRALGHIEVFHRLVHPKIRAGEFGFLGEFRQGLIRAFRLHGFRFHSRPASYLDARIVITMHIKRLWWLIQPCLARNEFAGRFAGAYSQRFSQQLRPKKSRGCLFAGGFSRAWFQHPLVAIAFRQPLGRNP